MNISFTLYALEPIHSLSAKSSILKREGALLKIIFDSGAVGYADCHAWPELNDLVVQQQLALLSQGRYTRLTKCALEFAALDAEIRSTGRNIFEQRDIPRSHFLVTDIFDWTFCHVQQIVKQGYTHVKLKMGRAIDREIECLHTLFQNTHLKLRLDFNETLNQKSFHHFLQRIHQMRDHIDFIEDPFPFDLKEWNEIQQEGWILACDREVQQAYYHPEAARILIVKPALHSFGEWQQWMHQTTGQTCIVTSYLGHPLGQVAAAYVAIQIDPSCSSVHGLQSHHAYRMTPFSEQLNWGGAAFLPPVGNGFGFDHELEKLNWVTL